MTSFPRSYHCSIVDLIVSFGALDMLAPGWLPIGLQLTRSRKWIFRSRYQFPMAMLGLKREVRFRHTLQIVGMATLGGGTFRWQACHIRFCPGRFDRRRNVMGISQCDPAAAGRPAWNAGRQVSAKHALKIRQIWSIRLLLDREVRMRDRALFDLAIASKLRGCDLVKIKIGTLVAGPAIRSRSMVIQQRIGRPAQFEISADTRARLLAWLERRGGTIDDFSLPSRVVAGGLLSTRQYVKRTISAVRRCATTLQKQSLTRSTDA